MNENGYPVNENAYIIAEDSALAPVYVQNVYKTAGRYGQKVAVISRSTTRRRPSAWRSIPKTEIF